MIDIEDNMRMYIYLCFVIILFSSGCSPVEKSALAKNSASFMESKLSSYVANEELLIPETKVLDVPFVMQAPFANWSEHNESCEEAGILLAHYYYMGVYLSKQQADLELKDMVRWQIVNYGAEYDIYAQEMGDLAKDYYGYDTFRVIDGTTENIEKEITNGNPVIVPTTAAYLKEEKSDYPEMGYHVVVIVGYDQYGFITHDPGTYSGEDFRYSNRVMQNAMRDYNFEALVLR
ncbi:C39 family peptidase [Patescibacteria group bacterium]|nr:C39 family peptidase [Patescibacteria group bacterium]